MADTPKMATWGSQGDVSPNFDTSLDKTLTEAKTGLQGFIDLFKVVNTSDAAKLKEKLKILSDALATLDKQIAAQEASIKALEQKRDQAISTGDISTATSIQTEIDALMDDLQNNQAAREDYLDQRAKAREDIKDDREKERQKYTKMLVDSLLSLKTDIEAVMDRFMETQQSMAYNLIGTGKTLKDVKDDLTEALNGRGIVRIEDVYKKIGGYVKDGIVYNAEQRAYLATLVEEVGLHFNVTSASLLRLVNLQRTDLTSSRLAVADSLKEYLNQNYETSQYIKDGFEKVSDALLEAQSLMNPTAGMELESTLQKWLGTLYSLGMSGSTTDSIAQALGYLGSGNLSSLSGSKLQNLIIMGASRSGADYAEMLTSGISSEDVNNIMGGIVSYLAEIGSRESNVVKSAFADLFGFTVSDLKAISNFGNTSLNGELGMNINKFLLKADQSIWEVTEIANILKNIEWSIGAAIASDDTKYLLYKTIDLVSNFAGSLLSGTSLEMGLFAKLGLDLGTIAKMVPVIAMGVMAMPTIISGIGTGLSSVYNDDTAQIVYNALGNTAPMKTGAATGNILGLSLTSGKSNSGSIVISQAGEGEVVDTAKTSATTLEENNLSEEDKDVTHKIYDLIGGDDSDTTIVELLGLIKATVEELPNKTWFTATDSTMSSVNIGGAPGNNPSAYMDDLLNYTALSYIHLVNIQSILTSIRDGTSSYELITNQYEETAMNKASSKDVTNSYG